MVRGLRTTFRNRTSSMQEAHAIMYVHNGDTRLPPGGTRTSTHGRYKPRASYRCLVPDSDNRNVRSFLPSRTSVNKRSELRNLFLHDSLAALSKRPVPTPPTCVGFVLASILRKFNIFFWNTMPPHDFIWNGPPIIRRDLSQPHRQAPEGVRQQCKSRRCAAHPDFFERKMSECLVVTEKVRTFAVA